MHDSIYLVRFGALSHIGPFRAGGSPYERGQTVVIESSRGTELGAILTRTSVLSTPTVGASRILRIAQPADLEQAHRVQADHPRRLQICERTFQDGLWPLTVIDVEPLLDEGRTVLYYVGPHGLDTAGLTARFREQYRLDLVFEPIGREPPATALNSVPACDRDGCGEGGCGPGSTGEEGHACGGCALKDLVRRRPHVPVS